MCAVKEDLPNHTSGPSNHDRFPQQAVIMNVHKSEEYIFAVKYNNLIQKGSGYKPLKRKTKEEFTIKWNCFIINHYLEIKGKVRTHR